MSSIANRISLFLPPKLRDSLLMKYNYLVHFKDIGKNLERLNKILAILEETNPVAAQNAREALRMYCLIRTNPKKCASYLDTYGKQHVRHIQSRSPGYSDSNTPILICAVKNDLQKVKMQIDHHRSLGIVQFVYIDNMSTDGTFEWLLSQEIDVYRTDDSFSAIAKNAWFRQITDRYGYDRWYLILDSDELFVYPGMEHSSISEYVKFLENQKLSLIQSFLIDMYPRGRDILQQEDQEEVVFDIRREYRYFDSESYSIEYTYKGMNILGGPRTRCFSEKDKKFSPLLTKNPLMRLQTSDVFGVHRSLPYAKNIGIPIAAGLLHYKFLPGDEEKYSQIVRDGNYSGGSAEYKQYLKILQKRPSLSFYYDKSTEFTNSLDLLKINVFSVEFCQRFLDLEMDRESNT